MRLYGKLLQTISEVRLSLYPSLFPRDPLDKSQLHAKQPSEVGERLTQHPSRPIFLSAYSNLHYLKFGHSREGTPPWDIRYPEEDI